VNHQSLLEPVARKRARPVLRGPDEVWFGIIERQATFRSVTDLNAKIRAFIDGWNDRCDPFICTKTSDQILTKSEPSDNFRNGPLVRPARQRPKRVVVVAGLRLWRAGSSKSAGSLESPTGQIF
jgi:hypothetical protein